jgi:hypothetical protein
MDDSCASQLCRVFILAALDHKFVHALYNITHPETTIKQYFCVWGLKQIDAGFDAFLRLRQSLLYLLH